MKKNQNIKTRDPKIITENSSISLFPYYWNYNFITFFLPIFASIAVLVLQHNKILNLFFIVIIIVSTFLILYELRVYNSIIVDSKYKIITIYPNPILGLIIRKKNIQFSDIKRFFTISNYSSSGFNPENRRYIIKLALKDDKEFSLISSKKKEVAEKIAENLFLLL